MASKKFEKGSQEWDMFQDYWKLCQKFWIPEDTDEYWEQLITAGNEFCKKYGGKSGTFPCRLYLAFHDTIEQQCKEARTKNV